jgi:hypothetical protein
MIDLFLIFKNSNKKIFIQENLLTFLSIHKDMFIDVFVYKN